MDEAGVVDRDVMNESLLQAFAAISHMNGCRSIFTFTADLDVVPDRRDFDFYVRLFFDRVDSQDRASFDPEFVCESKGEWFAAVAVQEVFQLQVFEEASGWLLSERAVRVGGFRLPLEVQK